MVMEPLRGGNLAGHVPDDVQKCFDAAPVKRSAAEWGLRWVWNHPGVTVVLSGMNEEAHLEENLRVAETALPDSLTESDLAVLEQARQTYRRLMKVDCTGCRYCMPCPSGVNIPECFAFYNNTAFFPHNRRTGCSTSSGSAGLSGMSLPMPGSAVIAVNANGSAPSTFPSSSASKKSRKRLRAGEWVPGGL